MDKRERASQFRRRLHTAMTERGITQSALARATGVDRSTISQLLKGTGARLPNAQVVGECASSLGVSADWLLSLTDRPESAADILAQTTSLTRAARALVDESIFAWHQEADGYKIRHVPAGLPDMLKTRQMMEWEYAAFLGRTSEQAIGASEDRLEWMRGSSSDYEIALPLHDLENFALAQGYYAEASHDLRLRQLTHLGDLCQQLYPRLRLYLYDARQLYSSPLTVFGPLIAALYLGQNYIVFRDSERIQAFIAHFDNLVRFARIGARETPDHIDTLIARIT